MAHNLWAWVFQPTRPLRGATGVRRVCIRTTLISTHAPLAGRDGQARDRGRHLRHFNPRAPCGARPGDHLRPQDGEPISTHAPLAGRDSNMGIGYELENISTHAPLAGRDIRSTTAPKTMRISTHAPLAGRDLTATVIFSELRFQPTRPLRGATQQSRDPNTQQEFQPTRPLRGATSLIEYTPKIINISTHAPLAGRDSKSVQITMHIFAITDKFQMLLHRMPPVRAFCSFLMQENHADFGCEPPK